MCGSVLNSVGLVVGFCGAALLVRFGMGFSGDKPGFNTPGKVLRKLHVTLERGQRLGFTLLATGFLFQFIAQLL